MKNPFISLTKEFIKVVVIVAIAVPAISLLAAVGWSGPTAAPPNDNAEAPVNVGVWNQIKNIGSNCGPTELGKNPDECGGLSVGTFISRLGTILAKDGGNVGIGLNGEGTEAPSESLDAKGFVKGRVGLCIGDDCRASWPPVDEGGIPAGYQEIYYNVGEDIYSAWWGGGVTDTCDFNGRASYGCKPEESRTCTDNNFFCISHGGCSGPGHRSITCKTSKILASGEGLKKSTVGTATITQRDYSGSSEWCRVKIQSSACNWEGRSSDSHEWDDPKCEMWAEGNAAGICFASKGLYAIWNRSGDSGPIEIFYRP